MDIFNVLDLIGGLALFLYGMNVMGNGLSKMAGGKLESILQKVTTNRFYGVLLGAFVTSVIQSSSATTVMVVGFVNSGIMELSQAVGVIMGANIGTTITSWMLSLTGISGDTLWIKLLKPTSFSPIIAAIGIILILTSKGESKKKDVGGISLGFAILMFGMHAMSSAVAGLSDVPAFTSLMIKFSNPIIGMIVGAILTAIIQSSSASVGILQALCITGSVNYGTALPIIMGQNIGTCVTSIISSVGANKNARRSAMVHLYFNLIGTVIFMVAFYAINHFVEFTFLSQAASAPGIAVIHSLFNVGATLLLFPFAKFLVKLAEITIPDDKNEDDSEEQVVTIDERFLGRPAFAMELCREKVKEMALLSRDAIKLALEVLDTYDEEKANKVIKMEDIADRYEDVIGSYLVKLSSKNISTSDSQSMSIILHSISDFERISDHAMDIVKSAQEVHTKGLSFTDSAKAEINTLCRAVMDICELTTKCFCAGDDKEAMHVEPLEEVIDALSKKIKENHIVRLQKGLCTIEMGFILEDVLTGLERISDHCSNVAIEMITIFDNDYNTHEYFKNFSPQKRASFNEEYEELLSNYQLG